MPRKFDATDFARKIITAISVIDESSDINGVIDFLTGTASEKMSTFLRQQEAFGAGADTGRQDWLNLIRDLISMGYVRRGVDSSSPLTITEKGWTLLKGQGRLWLARPPFRINEKIVIEKSGKKTIPAFEPDLLLALKELRKSLASAREVDADDIIPYLKLHQIATWLPATPDDLRAVAGFDDSQMKSFGKVFLKLITEYLEVNDLQSRMTIRQGK